MKISGTNTIPFPVDQVWDALLDPAMLVRTIPGCERLETTGDTRKMPYAVGTFASRAAVMSGSAIHLAALRAREKALRIAAEALEASEDDLEISDGVVSVRGTDASIDLGTVAVLSNPLRYAFDEASKAATQFSVGDPGKPPVAEDDEPGLEGKDFYSPPWICPSTIIGLIRLPQSCTTAYLRIVISAVCGSVSTITACMPLANVDRSGE